MQKPTFKSPRVAQVLERLIPRIEKNFIHRAEPNEWATFTRRVEKHFPDLFNRLHTLYGQQYDFFYHLESILFSITEMWLSRSGELKALDGLREADPHWFQSHRMVGATYYVDLFANDLEGLREKLPYLTEMGVTYLHLMPLFKVPQGDNDGGYAVSSYREVDSRLGTMEELADLAAELRHRGISLCLDFVLNHTSDEHIWAKKALAGDEDYQEYYRMFPDRQMPDAFEQSMAAIFPDEHPGAFTYRSGIGKWVWTSFYNYQWDLNYENPAVFNSMLEAALFLANQGVEILRMDAVAFLWKQLGTSCQNLPEAHLILQAMNAAARIAAPAMVLKSEAIVHPDEVRKYVGEKECQLSYNPQLMALLWNSLATRETRTLRTAMEKRFRVEGNCEWVNYIRCHDDIGWAFSNDDVEENGFDSKSHRKFLTAFYTGRFEGSFSRGVPFQEDGQTGDARVSGTCASLCGLEKAIEEQDEEEIDLAIRRIHLLHGVIMTIGGIPLIYLGDEIGTLNDYSYEQDIDKVGDSRWLHRARFDWEKADRRNQPETIEQRVYDGILRLIRMRQQTRAFDRSETEFVGTGNPHVLAYFRNSTDSSVLVLANFTEHQQPLEGRQLRLLGLRKTSIDIMSGQTVTATQELIVEPYQMLVLTRPA